MILARHFLSRKTFLKAKDVGVKTFLFNEIDFLPEEVSEDNITFFNCNSYRVESSWHTWDENAKIVNRFKQKFPQLFERNGYDITLAIHKAMYWSNFRTGFLWYSALKHFPENKIFDIDPMYKANKAGVLARYLQLVLSTGKSREFPAQAAADRSYKYLVHIKNDFQTGLYQNIIKRIGSLPDFKLFIDESVDKNYLRLFDLEEHSCLKVKTNAYPFPNIALNRLKGDDWYVLNIILKHWIEINSSMDTALQMVHKGLKAALINEAENGIYGAVVSEVFRKNNTRVYNTMNGIKSGEAQDGHINFDKWFVWDTQMKSLLVRQNHIADDKLIVSGHLVEDLIRTYQYRNSLPLDIEFLKDKKVISLFSVKGKRHAKLEAIRFLYELLKSDETYFLMIRPHPSERPEDYILPEEGLKNVHFVHYDSQNQNDTLHDQLLISDLSIVFGSTVALDSKWMGVPCITFEPRENSLIYCTDEKHIIHVQTIEEFRARVMHCSVQKKQSLPVMKGSVSDAIIEEIVQNN